MECLILYAKRGNVQRSLFMFHSDCARRYLVEFISGFLVCTVSKI